MPGPSGIKRTQSSSIKSEQLPASNSAPHQHFVDDDSDYDSDDAINMRGQRLRSYVPSPLAMNKKSYNSVEQPNMRSEVLTAPDLQLDWTSDCSDSDDEVVFVQSSARVCLVVSCLSRSSSNSSFTNYLQSSTPIDLTHETDESDVEGASNSSSNNTCGQPQLFPSVASSSRPSNQATKNNCCAGSAWQLRSSCNRGLYPRMQQRYARYISIFSFLCLVIVPNDKFE